MTSTSTPPTPAPAGDADRVLDALAWHALTTSHARFAEGGELARRYDPEVAGFVAIRDSSPAAWAALAELVGPDEVVLLSGAQPIEPPAGWTAEGGGFGHQMVLDRLAGLPSGPPPDIVQLTAADVPRILALIELTEPGPFRARTIELGDYFGVFRDGELIAMAGERLRTPAFTEVSAVCTHPDARGRGLASALSHHVASRILARGQTPLLHVAEHNDDARRVYERLGFVTRTKLAFVATRSPGGAPSPASRAGERS